VGLLGGAAAVVLPVLALVAALLVRQPAPADPDRAPRSAALQTSTLVCPGVDEGAAATAQLGVSSLAEPGSQGEVAARGGPLTVAPGRVASQSDDGAPAVVTGSGGLAPALLGTRSVATPALAAAACGTPAGEQWFTGVGAAAEHSSVLELTNPDGGPATADVTVYSATGVADVPALRGVAVPGGTTTRLDLSTVVPRRGDLSLRVEVVRGRLGVAVLDRDDRLDGSAAATEWLAPQPAPSTSTVLLGLTRGTGARHLVVANPGDSEAVVSVQVITPRATFTPEGVTPVRVPAQSNDSLDLDDVLAEASRRGAIGLLVESDTPVTASLRQVTGRPADDAPDLSLATAVQPLDAASAVVLPAGRARLLLSGAADATDDAAITVTASGADGAVLSTRTVDLAAGTAANVGLPAGTALVSVDPGDAGDASDAAVRAAVLVQDPGATVLPLGGLQRTLRVPDVRPGLP
jgi:hypothetical protein